MAYIIPAILIIALLAYAYARAHPSKPTPRFHNAELVEVLLRLEEEPLNDLFRLYQEEFGLNAARYARRTYHKWKAGAVRPNRQTFNRLLVHLPGVMSFDLKCEILRKLREEYCSKDDYRLTVYTDDWKEALTPLVTSIIEKARTAELPPAVEKKLRWLAGDEMHVARAILAESQARESRNAVSMLEQEVSDIERLLVAARGTGKVIHELRLPYGTITLNIRRR